MGMDLSGSGSGKGNKLVCNWNDGLVSLGGLSELPAYGTFRLGVHAAEYATTKYSACLVLSY